MSLHGMSDVTLHVKFVNITPLTVDARLIKELMKTPQTEKGWIVEKNDFWVFSETLELEWAYAV